MCECGRDEREGNYIIYSRWDCVAIRVKPFAKKAFLCVDMIMQY